MTGRDVVKREFVWAEQGCRLSRLRRRAPHLALLFLAVTAVAFGQAGTPVPYHPEWHRAPFLNLSDARSVATRYSDAAMLAHARPLSTTVADFDEDGMPDLAAGFETRGGAGAVVIHRGNVDALWPYGALRGSDPPAFHPDARAFPLLEPADFLAAGDFDADGHCDLVAAHAGSNHLWFLKGDGHGGFAEAQRVALPGSVTAMTSGEINRTDGLTDFMVAVTGNTGPQVLVFESPLGALRGEPEAFPLPSEATSLALIPLDGGLMNGLAAAAGRELLLIHGRDRRLTRSQEDREKVPAATITRQTFSYTLRSLAVGNFTSPTRDLAVLADDGQIHFLERSDAHERIGIPQFRPERPASSPAVSSPRAGAMPRTTAMIEQHSLELPATVSQPGGVGASLVTVRVAATGRDSLILIDPAGRKLHVISHSSREDAASLAVSASLDVADAPVAVQPMRINKDALSDLVVFSAAHTAPIVHQTAPSAIFTVTTTADSGDVTNMTPGSLRQVLHAADVSAISGSPAEIRFNIPDTDPNRDPNTGVFTLQPIGITQFMALDGIYGALTVDGYTQPGASHNTLTNGGNAHLLIEINGSLTKGPDCFDVFGANTIRGLMINNWLGLVTSGATGNVTTGGIAIQLQGSGNFIEGNFFGLAADGNQGRTNFTGILDAGGSNGNTIGGTLPPARNLFGSNSFIDVGMGVVAVPNSWFLEGNYFGTNQAGTRSVGPTLAAVDLPAINAIIGGTTPGAGNLISTELGGNIEIIQTQGCQNQCVPAELNLIQGNYIGTDLTGAAQPGVTGATGIELIQATDNTIGGTTQAARNIISANVNGNGVYLAGGSTGNLIEGNYIGTDVSGTQALPNATGVDTAVAYTVFLVNYPGSPVTGNVIGGYVAGAGNLISGNSGNGIVINSSAGVAQGNVIAGNLIGTDASGTHSLGNGASGVVLQEGAAGNTIGGTAAGATNTIAYNSGSGVAINPGANSPSNDLIAGNTIYSNNGAGVFVYTGTQNTVSQNSIYGNQQQGIALGVTGVTQNSNCQSVFSGANLLQNAPVLTAGTGTAFVSATATDPNGNTSEFSNCVATSLSGNLLDIAGSLNSTPNTTYTIEYFSNASCGTSGYGQGQVYLGAATYTTASSSGSGGTPACTAPIGGTLNLGNAELIVSVPPKLNSYANYANPLTATIKNLGPATAASVVFSDVLPDGVVYVSATTNLGTCSFASGAITCNLGNIRPGGIVTISLALAPNAVATFSNTVTVASATPQGNGAVLTASVSLVAAYLPDPDHLTPPSVLVGSPDTALTIVGRGFLPSSIVIYGGVTYPATFSTSTSPTMCTLSGGVVPFCTLLAITVPAAQLTASATVPVGTHFVTGIDETLPFNILNPPTAIGPVTHFVLSTVNPYPANSQQALAITAKDANNNTVTSYRGTVNLTTTDPAPNVFTVGGDSASVNFTNGGNIGTGTGVASTNIELQTFGTQSITATDASNSSIKGTLSGIVVTYGPAANLVLSGSPQATPPGHAFASPLSVTLRDSYGNAVPNRQITFTPPTTGASAALSSTMATTDSQGVASVTATANGVSGPYEVGVTFGAPTVGGDNADVFLLNNGSGLATLMPTGGTPQTTTLGTLFPSPLAATLLNGLGNPISGATVYFGVPNDLAVTPAAVTNASGVATSRINVPTNAIAGTFTGTATVGGLTASFTLTQQAIVPVVITITGGTPQSTATGTPFDLPLAVHVAESTGTPRAGVTITFLAPTSGASATLSANTVVADLLGDASITAAANGTLGTYNVTASVGGVTGNFSLTNAKPTGGAPASITASAGTPQSRSVTAAFATALKALVKDASGGVVSGASVTFTAPATGASGAFPGSAASATVLTDGQGFATAPTFTANTTVGTYQVTAKVGSYSTAFSLTNTAGAPAGLAVYSGNNQSATINTNFGTPVAVQVVDAYGNPCGAAGANLSGSFLINAGNSGANATANGSTSVTTDSNGIATAPTLSANGTAGSFSVTALFFDYLPTFQTLFVSFTLANTTSAPAALAASSGTPQSTGVTTAFPLALSAKVTDSGGTPLPGFTVNFTAPSSGASAVLSASSAITDLSGIATVNAVANAVNGSYKVTASIGSFSTTFSLTNTGSVFSKCDVNTDGLTTVLDAQFIINEALGTYAPASDLNSGGTVDVVDAQIVLNAILHLGCSAN